MTGPSSSNSCCFLNHGFCSYYVPIYLYTVFTHFDLYQNMVASFLLQVCSLFLLFHLVISPLSGEFNCAVLSGTLTYPPPFVHRYPFIVRFLNPIVMVIFSQPVAADACLRVCELPCLGFFLCAILFSSNGDVTFLFGGKLQVRARSVSLGIFFLGII